MPENERIPERKDIPAEHKWHLEDMYPTDADWEKAIRETLVRIKQNSMEQRRRNLDPTDMNGLKQIIDDKRRLQEMEKLHISFK